MRNMLRWIAVWLLGIVMTTRAAEDVRALTLATARETALRVHPRITVAELRLLIAKEGVRESQAAYYPVLSANAAAVGASEPNTRIASGGLTMSSVYDRASAGLTLSQLVTDFGRTANLSASSKLHAQAEQENLVATRAQLLLQVDAAYIAALEAQSVLRVTDQTVATRRLLRDQVSALASNQLKSELDVGFAEVGLKEAQLLRARALNDVQAAMASLATLLGEPTIVGFKLSDVPPTTQTATNSSELVGMALRERPELQRLRFERDSAGRQAKAERASNYPTISVQGSAGVLPVHDPALDHDYAAAGVVVSVPLFNGNLTAAKQREAELRAQILEASLRDEENNVVREVRIAALNLANAGERVDIAQGLLEQSRRTYALADARYKAGASSIVELSQAELSQTTSEIGLERARYEFLLQRSVLDYQTGAILNVAP